MADWDGKALVVLAALSGFSPDRKTNGIGHDRWAAAIALAESGGDPKAHNNRPPDNSYGLMQINMLGGLGPARRKEFGIKKNEELYDPYVNMAAAFKVYQNAGQKFTPWSTYPTAASLKLPSTASVSDKDRSFYYEGRKDILRDMAKFGKIPKILGEGAIDGLGEAAKLSESVTGLDPFGLKSLVDWLEGTALRIAAFAGGGILLVIALVMVLGQANTIGGAAKTVTRKVAG